jgi:tetratricopeptide (TPR) repeat protein
VVVATVGNDLRVEFKAVGDTVNLASRMEGLAEPGTAYVSGETFKFTEGLFRFEGLGEKEVKGKQEPVPVYRVIAPSTRRTRFDVNAERGLTPFVGRERELELLFDALERAKSGQGQAVSIVAPAGDGKSRHMYEFRKGASAEDVTFLEGKCLSYSRGVPYHPVIDILKGNFDIREGDGDEAVRKKVQRGLDVLGADDAATKPYLLELLSVRDSGIDPTLRPETRKDRTIQALSRIVLKGAEIRPLILAVEDLHWMDKSSEDVFKDLFEHIAGARVLLLFTYRPEYVHTWGGRSYHSQVTLNRLSNRETLAMAAHLLGAEQIAENLANLIIAKTEGVPFFIEEFLKSLRERQLIAKDDRGCDLVKDRGDFAIPSTIQDVLMARVDALPDGAKEVLQLGSIIEREFPYALIEQVAARPERELLASLSALKDAELLYERGVFPESTYVFKHALTREVVYDTILARRRKELHEAVGTAIEELLGEDLNESHGILCEHFLSSENYDKAARYAGLAGRRAEKEASFTAAIDYSRTRISCLEKLSRDRQPIEEIIDARTTLGLYITQIGQFAKAKEAIDPIVKLVLKGQYDRKRPQVLILLGIYRLWVEGDVDGAIGGLEEALSLATERNHGAAVFFAHYWLSVAFWVNCDFERAIHHIEKALEINLAAKSLWGVVAMKSQLAWIHLTEGNVGVAHEVSLDAVRLADEIGDIWAKSWALDSHGCSLRRKGSLDQAIEHLSKGAEYAEKAGMFANFHTSCQELGFVFRETGRHAVAKEYFIKSMNVGEDNAHKNIPFIMLTLEKWRNREVPVDTDILAGDLSNREGRKFIQGALKREVGNTLLSLGNDHRAEAQNWFQNAIETDRRHGQRWELARDYASYAEWFERQGGREQAREHLVRAIELFGECGADGWVKRTEEKLAQL